MRTFLVGKVGFVEKKEWEPNCWINVVAPTREDILFLTQECHVPEEFIEDIEDVDERSRLEEEDGWTLMIMRIPYKSMEAGISFITVPLGILKKDDLFVTICYYHTDMLPDFINFVIRKNVELANNWDLVFRLFLSSSAWYLKYLKQVNNQMHMAEVELERSIRNEELQRLLRIEKSLVFFITSLRGNDNLLMKMKTLRSQRQFFDDDLVEDVEIELRQAQDSARIYSDILSGTMDAFASVISNNLNIVMKVLASVTIILTIPSIIFGLWGSNVPVPFETSPYGFWIVIAIAVLFTGAAVVWMLKKKWL